MLFLFAAVGVSILGSVIVGYEKEEGELSDEVESKKDQEDIVDVSDLLAGLNFEEEHKLDVEGDNIEEPFASAEVDYIEVMNLKEDPILIHEVSIGEARNGSSIFDDWTNNEDVEVIDIFRTETILISNGENEAGTLVLKKADYIERGDEKSEMSPSVGHFGANLYFVPEGAQFPDTLAWSVDGAALYNSITDPENEDGLDGVFQVARFDTGLMELNDLNAFQEFESISDMFFIESSDVIESELDVKLIF